MRIYKKTKLSDEAKNRLDSYGYSPVDSKSFKDYELYLFEVPSLVAETLNEVGIPPYQVGFQRVDTDFTDIDQQNRSNPPESESMNYEGVLEWLKENILNWISQCGKLVVMSHSEDKNAVYRNVIKRMGLPTEFVPFQGYNVLIVG